MLDDMGWCRAPKPPLPKLPAEVVEALIAEARAQGLRATVHAPNLADAKTAVAAGATALAHSVIDPLDDATIAAMKARPVFYLTTLDIFEFLADTRDFVDRGPLRPAPRCAACPPDITQPATARADYAEGYRERYPNSDFVRRRLPTLARQPPPAPRRRRAGGAGHGHVGVPGPGRLDRDGRLRPRRDLSASRRSAPRPRPRRARSASTRDRGTLEKGKRADLLILTRGPAARRQERPRHRGRLQERRAGESMPMQSRRQSVESRRVMSAWRVRRRSRAHRGGDRRALRGLARQVVRSLIDSGREWIVPDALSRGGCCIATSSYWFGPVHSLLPGGVLRASSVGLRDPGRWRAAWARRPRSRPCTSALRRVADRGEAPRVDGAGDPGARLHAQRGRRDPRAWDTGSGTRRPSRCSRSCFASGAAAAAAAPRSAAGALAALAGLCRTEWGLAALSAAALARAARWRAGAARPDVARRRCGRRLCPRLRRRLGVLPRAGRVGRARGPAGLSPEHPRGDPRPRRPGGTARLANRRLESPLLRQRVARDRLRDRDRGARPREPGRVPAPRAGARSGGARGRGVRGAGRRAGPGPVQRGAARVPGGARRGVGLRGGGDEARPTAAALAGFGWMGLLASHRRVFFIDDAPYVAPPLLFAFVCAAGLLARAVVPRAARRRRARGCPAAFAAAAGALAVFAFAGRIAGYAADDGSRSAGPAGCSRARPELARRDRGRRRGDPARDARRRGLVVFPEGEVLNFLSGRPNPLRQKLYLPGYLTEANESAVIAELERARPGHRPLASARRASTSAGCSGPTTAARSRRGSTRSTSPCRSSAGRARAGASGVHAARSAQESVVTRSCFTLTP